METPSEPPEGLRFWQRTKNRWRTVWTTTRKRAGHIAYQLYLYVVMFLGYPLVLAVLFALSFLESPTHPVA